MTTPSLPIRFCFDFLSPYAYLAWHQTRRLADERGVSVEAVPVLLAGLLAHHGQLGPAEIPPKREYVFKDTSRSAAVLGIKLVPPPSHPFLPLLSLRVSGLIEGKPQHAVVDRFWSVAWGGERHPEGGLESPVVVERLLRAEGLDADALLAAAQTDDGKNRLKQQTAQAIAHGVFGVPTLLIGDELFFGLDSLPHAARFLDGNDPLDAAALKQWRDLPATARRHQVPPPKPAPSAGSKSGAA